MFRRQKQAEASPANDDAPRPLAEMLPEIVPVIADGVEAATDGAGLVQIRRRYRPRQGPAAMIAKLFRYEYTIRVNLDRIGTQVWNRVDGAASLDQIAGAVADGEKLPIAQAREAVMKFMTMLLNRHLVVLKVPGGKMLVSR